MVVTGVDEVPALLPTLLQDGDVVLTQGAGDIGRLTRLLAEEGAWLGRRRLVARRQGRVTPGAFGAGSLVRPRC